VVGVRVQGGWTVVRVGVIGKLQWYRKDYTFSHLKRPFYMKFYS